MIRLRRWRPEDANELARAWADPEVRAFTAVPPDASTAAAGHWIAGWGDRAAAGIALDLVIAPPDGGQAVLGEVGLGPISWQRRTTEIGYWLHAEHRGRGLASEAVSLLTGWALESLPFDHVVARTTSSDGPTVAVLRRCRFEHRGRLSSGHDLWATHRLPDGLC